MLERTIKGFKVTTEFNVTDALHSYPHKGLDLAMNEGTKLTSVQDAVVLVAGEGEKLGKYVKLKLEDGTELIYGHLSALKVKAGEIVHQGDVIALSGNTGRSTGPHLHLQAMKDGEVINPEKYAEKITAVKEMSTLDSLKSAGDFFSNMHDDGLWYAVTGQHFKEWSVDTALDFAQFIVDVSDSVALISLLILALFGMCGSKKARGYMYWTFIVYILLKGLGGVLAWS